MAQTLDRSERLGKKDFRTSKWKTAGRTAHFLLFRGRNEDLIKRFGVVVGRKVSKRAVTRNRIKRLLREYFRLNKDLFVECVSYSVRVRKMPSPITWDAVSRELHLLVTGAANG
jgi:ribonuclease P protein component